MPRRAGEALDEADMRALAEEPCPLIRRQEVHQCEKIGLGQHRQHFGERVLTASPCIEPVVDDGYAGLRQGALNRHQKGRPGAAPPVAGGRLDIRSACSSIQVDSFC